MAESYRGYHLQEATGDQVAVYQRGSFKGHFASPEDARGFVDDEIIAGVMRSVREGKM